MFHFVILKLNIDLIFFLKRQTCQLKNILSSRRIGNLYLIKLNLSRRVSNDPMEILPLNCVFLMRGEIVSLHFDLLTKNRLFALIYISLRIIQLSHTLKGSRCFISVSFLFDWTMEI